MGQDVLLKLHPFEKRIHHLFYFKFTVLLDKRKIDIQVTRRVGYYASEAPGTHDFSS